jgi:hypothetical protein
MFTSSVNSGDNSLNLNREVTAAELLDAGFVIRDAQKKVKNPELVNPNDPDYLDKILGPALGRNDIEGNKVLQEMLRRGIFTLYDNNESQDMISLQGDSRFYDTYDTSDDAEATATYESKMAEIQVKEKQLQLDLQQVETQQKACTTEIESVKKIIDKNIDMTFKVFA